MPDYLKLARETRERWDNVAMGLYEDIPVLCDVIEAQAAELVEAHREAQHWNDEWRKVRETCEQVCPSPEEFEAQAAEIEKLKAELKAVDILRRSAIRAFEDTADECDRLRQALELIASKETREGENAHDATMVARAALRGEP